MKRNEDECQLLEADATLKKGTIRQLGLGRLCLTTERLIWEARMDNILLLFLFRIPRRVAIDLDSIRHVGLVTVLWRSWLVLITDDTFYSVRPGRASRWFRRDNPETTEEWHKALKAAMVTTKNQ